MARVLPGGMKSHESDNFPPEIVRMLILSTAHISRNTNQMLKDTLMGQYPEISMYLSFDSVEFGWLIWVPDDQGIMEELQEVLEKEGAEGIYDCLKRAADLNCRYIKFDCDGFTDPKLPTYDDWN